MEKAVLGRYAQLTQDLAFKKEPQVQGRFALLQSLFEPRKNNKGKMYAPGNSRAYVEEHPSHEEVLLCKLHFYYEPVSVAVRAVQIEHGRSPLAALLAFAREHPFEREIQREPSETALLRRLFFGVPPPVLLLAI
jgi:hypothetical protein